MAEVKKNNHGTSCLQESTLKVTQRKGVELKSGNHDELGTIFLNYHRYSMMPDLSGFQVPLSVGPVKFFFVFY